MTIISSDHTNEIQFFRNHLPCPWRLKKIRRNKWFNPPATRQQNNLLIATIIYHFFSFLLYVNALFVYLTQVCILCLSSKNFFSRLFKWHYSLALDVARLWFCCCELIFLLCYREEFIYEKGVKNGPAMLYGASGATREKSTWFFFLRPYLAGGFMLLFF